MFNLNALIRPDVVDMEPYTPILPFDVLSAQLELPVESIIKLDANENPYGPSPRALEALATYPHHHIYPDPESRALRQALSAYVGVPAENLLAGQGADELIDLVMRLFILPGDAVINCPPTFGMYTFDADVNHARQITVRRRADFSLDIAAIESVVERETRVKLLIITSPNNPNGSLLPPADLERLLRLPVVVVLDEAYAEFSGTQFIGRALEFPNLIVLRTFSKWAGLAGLRVGYGAFPSAIIEQAWKIKQPYNVSTAAQVAALASLEDAEYLLGNVAKIIAAREQFQRDLRQIPWLAPYPSQSNFVLARVLGKDALATKTELARRGFLVRHYRSAGLSDHLRFSIGTPEQMALLVKGLQAL